MPMLKTKNLKSIFEQISEYWQPHIVGELNGQHVKAAKFKGQFPMHKHETEDEMFLVVKGEIEIEFTDYARQLTEGEIIVIPKGVEHSPKSENEAHVLLFEPISTLNTGDTENKFTHTDLKQL